MEIVRSAVVMMFAWVVLAEAIYHPITKTPNTCSKHQVCHKLAHCVPHLYSFKCVCKPGFFGDGQFCTRFPTCTRNPCPAGSTCLPGFLGGFRCVCNFGFYRVGRTCVSAHSCQFRCGRAFNPLFPCQCGPNCAQLGLCCKDFKLQCPRVILAKPPTPKTPYGQVHAPLYGSQHKPIHHEAPPHKPIHHEAAPHKPIHLEATHPPFYGIATHAPVYKPTFVHTTPPPKHYPHPQPQASAASYPQAAPAFAPQPNHFAFKPSYSHQPAFAPHHQPEFQPAIAGFAHAQPQFEPASVPISGQEQVQQSPGAQLEQATFVQAPSVI